MQLERTRGQEDLATPGHGLLAELGADDIVDWGDVECARELATIAGAGQEFAEREGSAPPFDELLTRIDEPIVLWTTDARGGLVAVAGAPFHGLADKDEIQICRFDQRTLTGATCAFIADLRRPAADQSELLDAGFLGEIIDSYSVGNGDVTVTPERAALS